MRVLITRDDGGVSIITPTESATEEQINRDVLLTKGYISHREIKDDEIPTDRYFRNAWQDNGVLSINIDNAYAIHMDKLRIIRDEKLKQLDQAYMKADEIGDIDLKQEIAQQKQVLRDIPQTYDLTVAKTPDDLKAMIPPELA